MHHFHGDCKECCEYCGAPCLCECHAVQLAAQTVGEMEQARAGQ